MIDSINDNSIKNICLKKDSFRKIKALIIIILVSTFVVQSYDGFNFFKLIKLTKQNFATEKKKTANTKGCTDIFDLKLRSNRIQSRKIDNILNGIFYAKQTNSFLHYDYYKNLSIVLPSIINIFTKENTTFASTFDVSISDSIAFVKIA